MAIKTYEEWKEAVSSEYKKLNVVCNYLNEDGKERLIVFEFLDNLTVFADTAAELVKMLEKDEDLPVSKHASAPIKALRKIAEQEGDE